jgi:hypothetical protein
MRKVIGKNHILVIGLFVIPIPFTNKQITVSRFEWFGWIRILQKYEYVFIIEKRPTKRVPDAGDSAA